MTINRGKFTDWSTKLVGAPFNRCSPNEVLIGRHLDAEFGTVENGCYGVRDIRAGGSISTHSFGAAGDRTFRGVSANFTAKRNVMLVAIEHLRQNSEELGIQAIHDYIGCRIWRSNRDPHTYPDGWKVQTPDAYGMGQTWADWIHVEVYEGAWNWDSPIVDRLGGTVTPPVSMRPRIGLHSTGPLVKAVQVFLIEHANQGAVVGNPDGQWGPRTDLAWSNFVIWTTISHPGAMTTDGFVDGVDWNVIAWNSGGWNDLYAAGFPKDV